MAAAAGAAGFDRRFYRMERRGGGRERRTRHAGKKLGEGVTRQIEWPESTLSATAPSVRSAGGRGAVLLSGPEPNFRWRSFCAGVAELAKDLGVELVVTMGALLADVPHSRPVSVAANSQDPALVENLGLSPSRYEGPTGITGVLHRACAEAGLPSVSF